MLNSKKKWTDYGTSKLVYMAIGGASNIQMARELARSPKSIERKKHRMKHTMAKRATFAGLMEAIIIGSAVMDGSADLVRRA